MKAKKIETKNYVTKYEAYDGQLFDSEEECRKYESTAKAVIEARAYAHRVVETSIDCVDFPLSGSGDDWVNVYYIKDAEALEAVNMLCKHHGYTRRIDNGLHTAETFKKANSWLYDGVHYSAEVIKKNEDMNIGKTHYYTWEYIPFDNSYIGKKIVFTGYDDDMCYGKTREEMEAQFKEEMDELFGEENK